MSDTSTVDPLPDAEDTCALCGTVVSGGRFVMLNGHVACEPCAFEVQADLEARRAGAGSLPLAMLGGALGAALGAAVWAGISIGTRYEIGYVAILVGFLAGTGVKLLTGGGHGRPLQIIAVVFASLGLVAAKYGIFAHDFTEWVLEQEGVELGWFSTETLTMFDQVFTDMFGGFDLLWLLFAVTAAWRVPGSPQIAMESR